MFSTYLITFTNISFLKLLLLQYFIPNHFFSWPSPCSEWSASILIFNFTSTFHNLYCSLFHVHTSSNPSALPPILLWDLLSSSWETFSSTAETGLQHPVRHLKFLTRARARPQLLTAPTTIISASASSRLPHFCCRCAVWLRRRRWWWSTQSQQTASFQQPSPCMDLRVPLFRESQSMPSAFLLRW